VPLLLYIELIGFTAGALLHLFLIALILGNRRPRAFERVLFFLILALFSYYCGALLVLEANIHYSEPPPTILEFASLLISLGLVFLPALLIQSHAEYLRLSEPAQGRRLRGIGWLSYAPALILAWQAASQHASLPGLSPGGTAHGLELTFALWLGVALAASAAIDVRLARSVPKPLARLHWILASAFLIVAAALICLFTFGAPAGSNWLIVLRVGVALSGVIPAAVLGYYIVRHNFLGIGVQKNLIYAVSAAFLALLYLGLVRRVSGWLEPILPPEATASILLFTLVIFFEPLERTIGSALQRTFKRRFDRLQRMLGEIQEQARQGDLRQLFAFVENRTKDEFGLSIVRLTLSGEDRGAPLKSPGGLGHVVRIPLRRERIEVGILEAASTGAVLTGEVSAALDFVAEQLPAMIDLCRLIEEKLKLERALAERDRLALLGQMAASISHNLRNPLGSMKTILQLQLESGEVPEPVRKDLAVVVSEIDRLSAKLTQLLQYSKPAAGVSLSENQTDGVSAVNQVVALLRHEADKRKVSLALRAGAEQCLVRGSEEALREVLSNLIINAVESQPQGGRVEIDAARRNGCLVVQVSDDGPGIAPETRARIYQPFFTTKASGTGLGLAIVAQRLNDVGGKLECESPIANGRGTKFTVSLPLAETQEESA
jgi:signal transduction histidine kinase